jgi:peptidoglycan/xylan/chitin deacetylase (PgdA/CDA1 family)
MISICFRLDDASSRSDHKLEQKIFDVFARLNVPLCVAVIPFAAGTAVSRQNSPHLFEAASAGTIEIALHGNSHRQRGTDVRGRRTEFSGLPLAEQTRLIREGLQHLTSASGCQIAGFVPPWNTYDASTMQSLAASGFEFLSVGFEAFRYLPLPIVIPLTCRLSATRAVVQKARRFEWLAPIIVVMFHSDDFMEYRHPPRHGEESPTMNLKELEALLAWIKRNPYLRAEALSEIARRAAKGTRLRTVTELTLPHRVKSRVPPMLISSPAWRTLPGILWGMFRSRSRVNAEEAEARPVVRGTREGQHF